MSELQNHTCINCGNSFTGKYCNNCGEKTHSEKDKKFLHFIEEGFHFITHFEGTFFHTIKTLFTKPGKYSEDFTAGIRKKYFKPLSLFLLLVIVYLLFPVFEGLNMHISYYEMSDVYGSYATKKIGTLLNETHLSKEELAKVFHQKGEKTSKFLLVIIIPFTALVLWLFTFKKRKWFYDQLIFATETNILFLSISFLLAPLVLSVISVLTQLSGLQLMIPDWYIFIACYLAQLVYFFLGARRFYKIKYWRSAILTVVFLIAHYYIVQVIYKFILFNIIIKLIH